MAKGQITTPAFEIVLGGEHLEDLGLFTAIWSQVDHMLLVAITFSSRTSTKAILALIDNTTTGQRLGMLRRLIPGLPSPAIQAKAEDVCSALGSLLDKRNHILHGVWGLHWNLQKNTVKPACSYDKLFDTPLYAKQLPDLCDRAAKLSLKLCELVSMLAPQVLGPPGPAPHRFVFSPGEVERPDQQPPNWQRPPARRSFPASQG